MEQSPSWEANSRSAGKEIPQDFTELQLHTLLFCVYFCYFPSYDGLTSGLFPLTERQKLVIFICFIYETIRSCL
jgi:hypothetical protein